LKTRPENILPWLLFCAAAALSVYALFSEWAINAELLGRYDMGLAIFFSVTFPLAIYTSCAIAVVAVVLVPFYRKSSRRGSNILLCSAVAGISPLVYIWALDIAGNNAV